MAGWSPVRRTGTSAGACVNPRGAPEIHVFSAAA